ncbi:hypothetical protein [uncultured Algimonas sp.]|uniref:GumC family protein n=1 Tax=uncultured Algimonas sp. TaxID=1547920 RepID=UPI002603BF43|nr:hypothetical protein [uncultured Algimonas sp.]
MFGSLMRQMLWVVPLTAVGIVAAWFLTADIKRTYAGLGTIMVQLGDEYVYQPAAGSQGQSSLMQTPDTITLNEVAIMKNPIVIDTVIAELSEAPGGLAAFDRDAARKLAQHPDGSMAHQLAYMELRKKMDENFDVAIRPRSSIIDASFEHRDPQMAVATMNRLIDAYMDYRRALFVDGASEIVSERRQDAEGQLRLNERRMASFLAKNGISDFRSEQEGASERTEDLRASLNALQAQRVETERSLASVEGQLRQTPATIDLYVDDRASNRIAQAELELKQLLAKYLPNSDPVRQKQFEIEQLRSLQQTGDGRASGGRRIGPNPVHQDLLKSRNTLASAADSLREREAVVQRQLQAADGKLRQMRSLSPSYSDIQREWDTLNTRVSTYLNKEQDALIKQQQSENAAENVRVISKATYPVKGRNIRMMIFVGASAAWGFTLFMLALFKVYLDPRLYETPVEQSHVRQNGVWTSQPPVVQNLSHSSQYHEVERPNAILKSSDDRLHDGTVRDTAHSGPVEWTEDVLRPEVSPVAYPDQGHAFADGHAGYGAGNPYRDGAIGRAI